MFEKFLFFTNVSMKMLPLKEMFEKFLSFTNISMKMFISIFMEIERVYQNFEFADQNIYSDLSFLMDK